MLALYTALIRMSLTSNWLLLLFVKTKLTILHSNVVMLVDLVHSTQLTNMIPFHLMVLCYSPPLTLEFSLLNSCSMWYMIRWSMLIMQRSISFNIGNLTYQMCYVLKWVRKWHITDCYFVICNCIASCIWRWSGVYFTYYYYYHMQQKEKTH